MTCVEGGGWQEFQLCVQICAQVQIEALPPPSIFTMSKCSTEEGELGADDMGGAGEAGELFGLVHSVC